MYKELTDYLVKLGINVNTSFGYGPSRKIKLLYTAFRLLKMPDYTYHNIKREFFLFPLVENLKDVIHSNSDPKYYDRPLKTLVEFWKERWCQRRSETNREWRRFSGQYFIKQQLKNNNLN